MIFILAFVASISCIKNLSGIIKVNEIYYKENFTKEEHKIMTDRNKELAKNTIILGFGQLVPKFLALIVLPILTAYLSAEEFGTYDLVISFASLLIPVITLQIQQAVFRYLLAAQNSEDKNAYVTNTLLYIFASSAIIMPIVFVVLKSLGVNSKSSFIICILFLSETFYTLLGQIVRGLGFNVKYSLSVIVYSVTNMILTVLFVAVLHWGIVGVILSLSFAYLTTDIYMVITSGMMKYFGLQYRSRGTLKELLGFSAPIVPSSIALWVVNLSSRWIILSFLGTAANGIYAVANKIPILYNTAYGIFNLAWTETASRVSDDGNPEAYYTKLFHGLFNFLIGVMLFMIAFTPFAFKILVKGDYGDAIYQIPILYFGVFFNSFVNFYSGIYIALKRTRQVGISSVAGAVLNVILNFLLIKKIGLYSASISTAFSFLVIVLYRAYDLGKVINIRYEIKSIMLGMVTFVMSSILIYRGTIIDILLCFLIAIIYNYLKNLDMLKRVVFSLIKRKRNA